VGRISQVNFSESDLVSRLLRDGFQPGGEELTVHLGELLRLSKDSIVLNVACGTGTSAIALANRFGCRVIGIDQNDKKLLRAGERTLNAGLESKLRFVKSDAESIGFDDGTFDAVICECALCTFPDRDKSLKEMFRVLKRGGRIGVADIVIERELPDDFKKLISKVVSIEGALPEKGYRDSLEKAGFGAIELENHSEAVRALLEKAEKLMRLWDLARSMFNIDLEKLLGITEEKAKEMLGEAFKWLEDGTLGYGLFVGLKSE
jgi:ubiquinone/menaquinone biosynthesis C-methylase UbiE